jgi:hypothetical protein
MNIAGVCGERLCDSGLQALGSGFGLLVTYSMSRYVAFRPTVRQSAPEETEALGK